MTPKQYSCRVIAIDDILQDARILKIEIDNRQRVPFLAGQYAILKCEGHDPRPFSIASAPLQPFLEFHIRNSGHGLSAHLVETIKLGDSLTIEAPLGKNYWHPSDRPILALAGGLGIVPIKSVIEAVVTHPAAPPLHLYWGARTQTQLYLDAHFRATALKNRQFSYIPVLSEETDVPQYRTGFAVHAVLEDFDDLSGFSIYMAGPLPMIEAALPLLLQKGADEKFIFSDAFKA
jgi:CDP-4-dehydro-6-deoxyglucose reductase/ferredoxin-NAD(P)+ reductase (naphthalene dioxygenase ferredoxin-specific)